VDNLNAVNRPVTLSELSIVFDMTPGRLERLLDRHGIRPACKIGRTRVYGAREIRRLWSVLEGRGRARLMGPGEGENSRAVKTLGQQGTILESLFVAINSFIFRGLRRSGWRRGSRDFRHSTPIFSVRIPVNQFHRRKNYCIRENRKFIYS